MDGNRLRVEMTRGAGPRGQGGRPLFSSGDNRCNFVYTPEVSFSTRRAASSRSVPNPRDGSTEEWKLARSQGFRFSCQWKMVCRIICVLWAMCATRTCITEKASWSSLVVRITSRPCASSMTPSSALTRYFPSAQRLRLGRDVVHPCETR